MRSNSNFQDQLLEATNIYGNNTHPMPIIATYENGTWCVTLTTRIETYYDCEVDGTNPNLDKAFINALGTLKRTIPKQRRPDWINPIQRDYKPETLSSW